MTPLAARRSLRSRLALADDSDQTMADLFNAGYKKEQVLDALRQLPVHPAMKRAVTNLKNKGDTTFLCLSNSNEVYIGTILEVSGLVRPAEGWADEGAI